MILVVLVVVGLFLHHDASGSSDDSWINVLKDSYAAADRMAAFFIGCLSAFGCLFLVVYTVCACGFFFQGFTIFLVFSCSVIWHGVRAHVHDP
jgi:hypothetical protein